MNGTTPQRPTLVHQPTSTKRKRLSDGQADDDMVMADDSGMANGMEDMGGIHGAVVENGVPGWQGRIFEHDKRETKVSCFMLQKVLLTETGRSLQQMRTADNTPTAILDDPFLAQQFPITSNAGMSLPMTPVTVNGFPDASAQPALNGSMDVDKPMPGQHPLSVQPFSPSLGAPSSIGLLQPAGPADADAVPTTTHTVPSVPMHEMQESEGLEIGSGMGEADIQRIRQEVANARNVHG